MKSPNAVLRVSRPKITYIATTIHTENGRNSACPLQRNTSPGLSNVMIWPSVISWATPRPATISTSVATIG